MQPWYALFEEPQIRYGRMITGWGGSLEDAGQPIAISPEFPNRIIPWQAFLIAKGYDIGCECISGEWNAATAQATRTYATSVNEAHSVTAPEGYVKQGLLDHAGTEDDYATLAGDAERYQAECQARVATLPECKKMDLLPGALPGAVKVGLGVAGLIGAVLVFRGLRGA